MKRLLFLLVLIPSLASAQAVDRRKVCVTPTVTAGAYSAYDSIGGLLTFPDVIRSSVGSGVVTSAIIYDLASNTVAYELALFTANPSATTFTDNSAIDLADADLSKQFAEIEFATTNRFAYADNSTSLKAAEYWPLQFSSTSRTVYGALRSTGTPTYSTTSDLTVCIIVESD